MADQLDPSSRAPRRGWERRQIVVAIVCVVILVVFGSVLTVGLLNRGVNNAIDSAIAKGQRAPAPDFSLPVLNSVPGLPTAGKKLTLSSLRGRPIILNIWASWCGPCTSEAPILQSVWDHYRAKGVLVLGVDVKDLTGDALTFHNTYGLTFPSVRDGEGNIEGPYGTTGVPESFVIDRQGRVAAALRGPLSDSGSQPNLPSFLAVVDQVLAEPRSST